MEWYDITGNISDLVMAGSALGAYLIARDYFSDVIKKDGYEHIKRLQLELIPALERNLNLSSINLLDVEVPLYIAGEKGVFQDEDDDESTLRITLENDLKSLKKSLSESYRLEREIKSVYKNLEVFGWSMIDKKELALKQTISKNHEVFIHVHNIVLYLEIILSRTAPDFLPSENDDNYSSKHLPPQYRPIQELVEKLIENQRALYNVGDEDTPYVEALSLVRNYYKGGRHLNLFFKYTSTHPSLYKRLRLKLKLRNKFTFFK